MGNATMIRQAGAIPVRRGANGLEVLLVTSRTANRWIVPKGYVETHLTAAESATLEAYEEAGVRGRVRLPQAGVAKFRKDGEDYLVDLFRLDVTQVLDEWPEDFRTREWVSPSEAAGRVREPDLAAILSQLDEPMSTGRQAG